MDIKDIKVTFLRNVSHGGSEKIRVFFKDTFKNDIQIDLRPGEIVYSQTNQLSNSLKIYSKKGIIKIEDEKKPCFLKYYVGYKKEEVEDRQFLSNLQQSLTPQINDIAKTKKKQPKKPQNGEETIVDKAIKDVEKYSEKKKPSHKRKKGPGRPKKRGPKKGSSRKKIE
jgi:hypothetical protein